MRGFVSVGSYGPHFGVVIGGRDLVRLKSYGPALATFVAIEVLAGQSTLPATSHALAGLGFVVGVGMIVRQFRKNVGAAPFSRLDKFTLAGLGLMALAGLAPLDRNGAPAAESSAVLSMPARVASLTPTRAPDHYGKF
jgi:hypothetical protein